MLIGKTLTAIFFWIIFILVVFRLPYPNTITEADLSQLVSFFIPLFLALTFTFNLLLKNFLSSTSISLGIISLLILKALDALNIITGALVIVTSTLLISYFKKIKRSNLTKLPKIPKLTRLRRENQ